MKSGPAASLRWRSRLSKEAVNQDDSSVAVKVVEDYGLDEGKLRNTRFRPPRHLWSRLVTILAAVCSGCSLYVLEVDMSWYSAITSSLNIFLSIILVYAIRRTKRLGSVRQQVQYGRQRVQSLSTQNERLYRQLNHLDGMQNRLQSVQHDLSKLIGSNDPKRMVTAVERWRVIQKELNIVLQQQVQQEIIKAVLDTDQDANFEMSAQELERLVLRLQNMPGIQLDEGALRRQLEMEDDRSLQAILRLIRRILEDTSEDVEMASKTAIVKLDASALCRASRGASL
mmetsp:Transcript_23472/g.44642  ORF Transcript_23472/g.44642 Transcript_23472/m.44642 type:complete len:284 (-) Transcript_23472:166-1017(-)|eukprot:scaffold10653_cov175-Amphora_coffeaeformis.AAC.4